VSPRSDPPAVLLVCGHSVVSGGRARRADGTVYCYKCGKWVAEDAGN
jgi:hypothetical protein